MRKVIFTNVAYLGNAGDFWSSPVEYYEFPNIEIDKQHFLYFYEGMNKNPDYTYFNIKDEIVVIGGGGLITDPGYYIQDTINWLVENNKVIFWGIGSNAFEKPYYDIFNHKNVLLVGTRDINLNLNHKYVPCVSCKMNLLDKEYLINTNVGIIEHPSHPIEIYDYPKITNSLDIVDIIDFIGSKEILISSTYHGIYWSQLLNKKVLYYNEDNKINTKYYSLKNRVLFCNKFNYKEKLKNLSYTIGMKEECRNLNDNFYNEVIKLF